MVKNVSVRNAVLVLSLFVAGGLAGLGYDQIHVRGGAIRYADPLVLGQPWWVGPQYGLATVTACLTGRRFVVANEVVRPAARRAFVAAGCFLAAYCASVVFNAHAAALAGSLVAVWLAQLLAEPARRRAMLFCAAVAVVGTSYEAALTRIGAFRHQRPDVLGVPYWLPALYLLGGLLALALARSVKPQRGGTS